MTKAVLKSANDAKSVADYFPKCDYPLLPLQDWAIVQLKKNFVENKTRGGIILSVATSDDELSEMDWNETYGKVIALGPLFGKDAKDMSPWPETVTEKGRYGVKIGDYVRITEFIPGKFLVKNKDGTEVKCIRLKSNAIIEKIEGDVLDAIERVKRYIPMTERKMAEKLHRED